MGQRVTIKPQDIESIGAYLAEPVVKPRGGVVVVQEIFGITPHIRAVADRFAEAGYTALAPACFDYVEPDTVLEYDRGGINRGRSLAGKVGMDHAVAAVAAGADALRSSGKVGVVGFCWGGTVALLAAQRLGLPAVSYYGSRNVGYLDQPLKAPVIFHFGEADASIPPEAREQHRKAWPDAPVYVYARCGHAFNRDVDKHAYAAEAAKLAWQRTMDFFAHQLGAGA